MNSLTTNIVEFISVLRLAGVRVSISESIDAIYALEFANLSDRTEVKTVLAACLAKSQLERALFSEAFEKFFLAPGAKAKLINAKRQQFEVEKQNIIEQAAQLKFQNETIELSDDLKETYYKASKKEKEDIIEFLSKTSNGKNVKPSFKPTIEKVIKGKLQNLKQKTGSVFLNETTSVNSLDSEIIAEDVINSVIIDNNLLQKSVSDINIMDMPKVMKIIKQITEKIRKHSEAKYKKTNKKTKLDLRRTIRSNLSTGSVQFKLKFKMRSKRMNKYLTFCDISSSMYKFSSLALQFIIGLSSVGKNSNLFNYIFSEDSERIKSDVPSNISAFESILKGNHLWGKGTNIDNSLKTLLSSKQRILNSSLSVIIISDAKTVDFDKLPSSMKALNLKVKSIIWLNPIPQKDWSSIPNIEAIKYYCTMLDCSTLEQLASACALLKI